MNAIVDAFGLVLQTDVLIAILLASIYGLVVGSLPGLSATMATALLVPVLKIIVLALLLLSVRYRWAWAQAERTHLYRMIETIGRWSMLDIFVVALLIALVRFGGLGQVNAGNGAVAFAAVPVLLFLFCDLLTVLTAGFVAQVLFAALPMVLADDTTVKVHGWIALGLLAVPLAASLRALGSGKEFIYSYEDVPPHVRRIAER